MRVIITGSSSGMGLAITKKFLNEGHEVHGIDILPMKNSMNKEPRYVHHIANIAAYPDLPTIENVNILVNNAGVYESGLDLDINLKGLMNVTQKYALENSYIRAVINQADASAHLGTQAGEYVASKGGVIAYTRWTAKQIAKYGATCNSLSFAGVETEANKVVMDSPKLWSQVMELTPLKHWTSEEEVANWVYFLAFYNHSCSGQDILIDNLESLNGAFVWE